MAETLNQRVRKLRGATRNGKCPHCPRWFDTHEQLAAHVAREHASEHRRPNRRPWSLATAVGIVGGSLVGLGHLVVLILSDSNDSIIGVNVEYTVPAVLVLAAAVVVAAPKSKRDSGFWFKVGAIVGVGMLTALGTLILIFMWLVSQW